MHDRTRLRCRAASARQAPAFAAAPLRRGKPAHPRTHAPAHPRTLVPGRLRTPARSHPRALVCSSPRGFTLIEVLIVMVLVVILASMGLALYTNSVTRAKEATLKQDLFQMRDVISQYYADKNKYPPTLDTLVDERYLRRIPVDPVTGSPDTWQIVLSDPEPGNPAATIGVFDVKSGSDAVALDGTRYSDW